VNAKITNNARILILTEPVEGGNAKSQQMHDILTPVLVGMLKSQQMHDILILTEPVSWWNAKITTMHDILILLNQWSWWECNHNLNAYDILILTEPVELVGMLKS
jgi:hypothetical protein